MFWEPVHLRSIKLIFPPRYFENNPSELNLDPTTTCLVGMGMGILAAMAISLAPTLADIPITGAEVVRVAFRMGIHVDEISQNLEPRPLSGSPDPWAYVVSEVSPDDVQEELNAFQAKEVTRSSPVTSKLRPTC